MVAQASLDHKAHVITVERAGDHMHKRATIPWLMLFVLAILATGLTGCGGRASTASSIASAYPTTSPSPTIPSATVTAAVTPAVTTGWAIYRDSRTAFQVPLPPGWWTGSFTSATPNGPDVYNVQCFPPHSYGQPGAGAAAMEPELIEITVVFAAPYVSFANNPDWSPEAYPVAIGSTPAMVYDRILPDGEELLHLAATYRGRLQFLFELHLLSSKASVPLDPAKITSATALFLGMMQGFQYPAT